MLFLQLKGQFRICRHGEHEIPGWETILSGGLSAHDIHSCSSEYGVSQVFIAIDIRKLHNFPAIETAIDSITADLHDSVPENDGISVRYPGENIKKIREKSLTEEIPVDKKIWEEVLSF